MPERGYDVVPYGASSSTGKQTVPYSTKAGMTIVGT